MGFSLGGLGDFFGFGGGNSTPPPQAPAVSTSTSSPWAEQVPYLQQIFGEAQKQYGQGLPEFYPGQGVAGFNPDQLQAMQMVRDQVAAGSPAMGAAQSSVADTLGGKYLGSSNPYLDQIVQSAQDEAQSRLASTFGSSGRYGSGLHQIGLGKEIMGVEAGLRGSAYENERNRMNQALGYVPGLEASKFADINALSGIGALQQGQEQQGLDYARAKYDYDVNRPQNALMNYLNAIQGNYGGSTTGTSTQAWAGTNPTFNMGGALGGAMKGYQMGGPWGAAGGGLLGGLF